MQQKVGKTFDPSSGSFKTCDHSGQRLFVSVLPAGRDIPPESGVGLGGTLSTGLNFIDTRPPTLEPGLLQTLCILNNLIQKIQIQDL
jgi:hypothetical protein